jgi:hypothetical protein
MISHQFHEVSTGGIFELKQKLHEEGKYYLVFDDKKIRASKNEFQLVEVNQLLRKRPVLCMLRAY